MAALVARNDFERAKAVFKSGPSGASRRPRRSTASHAQRLQSQQNFRRVSQLFKKLDSGLSDPAVLDSSTTDQSAKVTNTLAQIEFSFNEAELNAQAQAILDKHPNADWKAKYEAEKQTRLAKEKEKDGIVERAVALEAEALQLKKEYTYMVKESIEIKEGLEAAATRERSQLLLEEWNFLLLKYNELAGHLLSSSNAQKEIQGQLKEFRESVESAIRRTRGDTGVLLRRARAMPKRKKPEITFKRAAQSVNEEEPTRPLVTADKVAKKPDPRVLQIHSSISVVNNEFDLLEGSRSYIDEATFRVVSSSGQISRRHVFLFSDVLVVCRLQPPGTPQKYKYEKCIYLNSAFVWSLENSYKFQNAFEIMKTDEKFSLCLSARTPEEKTTWMEMINKQIPNPTL